jgi:uncharacterized membrane protein
MKRSLNSELVTGLLILLFIYTATSKLLDFSTFRHVLSRSPLIGNKAPVVAWILPLIEILISMILILPRTRRIGLWSSFALMLTFTGYVAYMLVYAPQLPCSCGGVIKQMTWKQHLVFNITYTLIAFLGIWLYQRPTQTVKPLTHSAAFND